MIILGNIINGLFDKRIIKYFKIVSMETEPNVAEISQELQRPINCLMDTNRSIRKQGLTSIETILFSKSPQIIATVFQNTKLYKNLSSIIDDSVEKHREIALKLIKKYLTLIPTQPNINTDIIEVFFKTLIHRINSTPFAETCEELRLEIIKIFELFLPFPQPVLLHLNEFSNSISKCLGDSFPDLKKQCCVIINLVSSHPSLKFKIGYTASSIVKALANNLGHQHAAVRKAAIESLGNLLVTEGCGQNYQHVKQAIFGISFNKSGDVRKATFECVSKLINYFSLKSLSAYEGSLVGILLNGLSDESPEIVELTKNLIDQCGRRLMQTQGQSGDNTIKMEVQTRE